MKTLLSTFILLTALVTVVSGAPSPIPTLTCTNFSKAFAPAYLGNNFIGLRPGPNPLLPAKTVVAGYVFSHGGGFEMYAPAPYPLGMDLRCGGASLRASPEKVAVQSQTLDMASGELTTRLRFTPAADLRIELEVLQFLPRSTPSVACEELAISTSRDAEIEVLPIIDRVGIAGGPYRDQLPGNSRPETDQVLGWSAGRNNLGIALAVPREEGVSKRGAGRYVIACQAGQPRRFRLLAALVSEFYSPDPELQAIRLSNHAVMQGYELLRQQNRQIWADLWKARIKVDGNPEDQRALDIAFFYLHSSVHPAASTGVAPFGLSQWSDYFGHVFWDQDHWIFHTVLLASPEAGRSLLEFRLRGLEAARQKAALFGYRGMMFPWEAGLDGSEVTPTEAETSWAQHHVNVDAALAFWEYYLATGDKEFLLRGTWPVLRGVAGWIASRGEFTGRGFEIRRLLGPDETFSRISNSVQMNMVTRQVMRGAIRCAAEAGASPPPLWQRIADTIVLPTDPQKSVLIPFDGAKPDPARRSYSIGIPFYSISHDVDLDLGLLKRTFDYEESLREVLPNGQEVACRPASPGFTCPPYAVGAALAGDPSKAARFFRYSWENYLLQPYGICKEYQPYHDGCYLMNLSALLQAAMYGFTGVRITEGQWARYPATLPEGWTKVEVERLWIKGKPVQLVAEHGKLARLIPLEKSKP